MAKKLIINPGLLAALDHFGNRLTIRDEPHLYLYEAKDGLKQYWSEEQACSMAYNILGQEELAYFELKMLKEGIKQFGMEGFYQRITGMPLEIT